MARDPFEAPSQEDDRLRGWQKAAEFNGRPVLTLLCGGAMMLFGLVPIGLAVDMAWSARHWIETPIEVLGVGLRRTETNSDLGTVVSEARATYRYRVGRFTYAGSRIGVHLQAADNVGGWQRRWAETLAARERPDGSPLTAWVDPDHPERAVLDAAVRDRVSIGTMPLGLLALLFAGGQPACSARASAALFCPSLQAEASAPKRGQEPPTAAPCSRSLRTGVAGQRIKRDAGGPPVFFHFEPRLHRGGTVRPLQRRQARPATRPGTSRAPPLTPLA